MQGYDSCLLELPDGLYSYNAFLSSNYPSKFNAAIRDLLQHYNGPSSTKSMEAQQSSTDESSFELDGN